MNKALIFCLTILLLTISACDPNKIMDQNTPIPNNTWKADHILNYQVVIQDTQQPYSILINIRNSYKYPYSNLYLFVTTSAPNGNSLRDTLDIILSDPTGKPLGKGLGDISFLQVYYKKNVRFPHSGIYNFQLQHAMREETLHGILDIGLRIEKTN